MKHKIAAIILSIILVLLIGVQLVDFTAFALSAPTEPLLNSGHIASSSSDLCISNVSFDED